MTLALALLGVSVGLHLAGAVTTVTAASVQKIVFGSGFAGSTEIYIMNADGSNPIDLTNNPADDSDPSITPDGTKIAFRSNRDGGNYEIYVMNLDGTNQTRLTNNAAFDGEPSFSADGSKIAFSSTRDGGEEEIYIMNADGTNQTRLTNNPRFDGMPAFSNDGTKIVFSSTRDGNYEIYVMNADGTNQTNLSNNGALDQNPSLSPDGSKIIFTTFRGGNYDIYNMNPDGSNQTNLTNNPAFELYSCFSPEGTKIAFYSDRDGNAEIYSMNANGTNVTRLTFSGAFDAQPSWGVFHDSTPVILTVNKTADTDDGVCDTDCSLREALAVASIDGDPDMILFNIATNSPGCVGSNCTINLSSPFSPAADGGLLTTIDGGAGANAITLSGGGSVAQIFSIGNAVNLSANNLNMTGANGNNGNAAVTIASGGTMTITNSALYGNSNSSFGGALKCDSGCVLNLTNLTVSGNTASNGGGIFNVGTITATSLTVTGNSGGFSGGGVFNNGTFNIRNTIIAGNSAFFANLQDVSGGFNSQGYNLIGKTDGSNGFTATSDQTGTNAVPLNPLLGTLGDNGGKTRTHSLLTNSPALDNGKSFGTTTDQRGFVRPYDDPLITNFPSGDGSDIGAFELQPAATPTATSTPTSTATSTSTPTATATATATPGAASINGTVTYGNAAAPPKYISNVTVTGTGSPNVFTTTAAPGGTAGQYTLTGFGAGSYTVSLSKTTGQNGITSNDAARIAQHVSGAVLLTTSIQKVSADVSNNGVVSSFDAAQIATFVATGSSAGIAGQWRFFVSPGPTFPVGASPTSRTYSPVTGNLTGENYIGLLMGEVTGNWVPSAARTAGRDARVPTGPERGIGVELPQLATSVGKEVVVPLSVQGVANKDVISYEFNLRYDPAVIQPIGDGVDVKGTASRGLSVVVNPKEPGLLRVVVYGAMPIDKDGVLLNLRFTSVGVAGSVSPISFERIMFNDGEPRVTGVDGRVELF